MAKKLAKIYGEDEEKIAFTGLIHDIAKEMKKEEILEFVQIHNIEMDEIEQKQLGLMHAKLGAIIAKERYNVDSVMQNAILYHTTGNINMDRFAKIIYIADKIEENRTYEGVQELRELAKSDLDKTILELTNFVIQESIEKKRLMHMDTIKLRNHILQNS